MMGVQQLLVLFTLSYATAINIFLDGPLVLRECQSGQHYGQLMVERQTVGNIIKTPAQTTIHIYAREDPARSTTINIITEEQAKGTLKSQDAEEPGDPEAFYAAARDGDIDYINAQLKEGKISSSRLSSLLTWSDDGEYDKTALHAAAWEGHVPVVMALLEAGATPNVMNRWHITPVHYAANNDHTAVLRALLQPQYKANVNQKDYDGWTPVFWASMKGKTDALEVLLDHGGDVQVLDSYGKTPLMRASQNGHVGTIQALITAGARVRDANEFGTTALQLAAENNHHNVVHLLLQNGADKWHKDSDGHTAADWARKGGHDELADIIDNWQ